MTFSDALADRINRLVDEQVEQKIKALLSELGTSETPRHRTVADIRVINGKKTRSQIAREIYERESGDTSAMAEPTVTHRRRRRGAARASKVYEINVDGRVKPDLFPTAQIVFNAIKTTRKPITAFELEKATGLTKKTVESCVWYLRNHDADGNRLDLSTRAKSKALIVSSQISE